MNSENKSQLIEAISKVNDDSYRLMAWIAITFYSQDRNEKEDNDWITFSTLKALMTNHGYEYSEGGNRGIASSVSAAQTYYGQAMENAENKNDKQCLEYIRHAIAVSFRNKDGYISYDPDKPDKKIYPNIG